VAQEFTAFDGNFFAVKLSQPVVQPFFTDRVQEVKGIVFARSLAVGEIVGLI